MLTPPIRFAGEFQHAVEFTVRGGAGDQDAEVLAATNLELVWLQIPFTSLPPPIKRAADAIATKAIRREYSIKS